MELDIGCFGDNITERAAIIRGLIQGDFKMRFDPTIEDSYRKPIEVDDRTYMLTIHDTAGTDEFESIRDAIRKSCQGFVLFYSIIYQSTFDNIPALWDRIVKVKETEKIPLVLVGSHCDLVDKRVITTEQGEALAKKMNAKFFEASGKRKINIDEIFFTLAKLMIKLKNQQDSKNQSFSFSKVIQQFKPTLKPKVNRKDTPKQSAIISPISKDPPKVKVQSETIIPQITVPATNTSQNHTPIHSFQNSNYKKFYTKTPVPTFQFDVLSAIKSLIEVYQKQNSHITQEQTQEFLKNLQKELLNKVSTQELQDNIEIISTLLWTSAQTLQGTELCSILNHSIRLDSEDLISSAVVIAKGINLLCVTRRSSQLNSHWPDNNLTFRGGGIPNSPEVRSFYVPSRKYRAPMFLSTSFSERVAHRFCQLAVDRGHPPVKWYFYLDPKFGCNHVNYIERSQVQGEDEFLFSAYSVFTVKSVEWKDDPNWMDCHEIHVLVSPDNQREPEDLPLGPWC